MDYFSDFNYAHLMGTTIQKETFTVKSAYGIWTDTFEVKIKIHNAYIGIFFEQLFRSAIDDSNQKITLFGFGYHYQIPLLKEKFKL